MTPPPTTWTCDTHGPSLGGRSCILFSPPSGQRRPGSRSTSPHFGRTPMATGLYDPAYEHDACGVGMVADLHGRPDHDIVDRGLTVLERLAHRGASGAEVETGDGAGILVQIPHRFLSGAARPPASRCPTPGATPSGSPSCRPTRTTRRRPGPWSSRRRPKRGSPCWAGARCRPSRRAWARPRAAPCRSSSRSSWRRRGPAWTPWRSSGGPSCCASGPSTPSTGSTSRRSPRGPSSTRAC